MGRRWRVFVWEMPEGCKYAGTAGKLVHSARAAKCEPSSSRAISMKWFLRSRPTIRQVQGIPRKTISLSSGLLCGGTASLFPFENQKFGASPAFDPLVDLSPELLKIVDGGNYREDHNQP